MTVKFRLLILVSLIVMGSGTLKADPLRILPFVKGSFAEIKQQYHDRPFVLIFWSESCSYCMKELAMFGKLQKQYQDVELVVVATDPFLEKELVMEMVERSQLDLQQAWVFAEQFPEIIYADVNKRWRGELPVTHFFDRNNREVRHMGIVNSDELIKWLDSQSLE